MKPYDYLSNDDSIYVCVAEHSDAQRLEAANEACRGHEGIDVGDGPVARAAIEELAAKAIACSMSQHKPGDSLDACMCEADTWWCESPKKDETVLNFYEFEYGALDEVSEKVERAAEDAEEAAAPS